MKAVAFANNDIAVVAWTFGGKLPNCLGFAVYRIDVRAGTETCLPAMATFSGQQATPGRTTADDPVQKFFWKDVYAKRGGTYKYKIVPMTGTVGSLQPMPYGPLISNQIQLSPHYGSLSAYFNRGILATQATAHVLTDGSPAGSMVDELKAHIIQAGDPLRLDLAGQMLEALTTLSDEAADGGEVFCALYEFQDPEVIDHLAKLKDKANVILSNMPGTTDGKKTNDTYTEQRQQIRGAGANVIDRFMPSGHIGHNKFQVLDKGGPQAVLFGSTNWTSNALCAQTNNSIIARSPGLAGAFYTAINGGGTDGKPPKRQKGDPPLPEDYRVIRAQGVSKDDAFGQWEAELNQAGHAVIHDKIVVVDPFSDNCVVITGSHNLGYAASYNNDENMAIIRSHRAIAEAYAAHCLDVYDHYAWRYWLSDDKDKAWHFLTADDTWQDGYFSADNQVKSAELGFWLGSTPAADSLPTPNDTASVRTRPALQAATGGITPAVGPHSVVAHRGGQTPKSARRASRRKTT